MKVLWFSNTPASGSDYLGIQNVRGGWLSSLDKELAKHVDLHVAFEFPKRSKEFQIHGICFHPISPKSTSKVTLFCNMIFGSFIDDEHCDKYLETIRNVNPDIIHIHGTENPFGVILRFNLGIPIVISIQGNNTVYHHKYFSGLPAKLSFGRDHNSLRSFLNQTYYQEYQLNKRQSLREQKYLKLHKNIIGRTDWDRRISSIMAPDSRYFHNDEVLRDSFYKEQWNFKEISSGLIIQSTIGRNYFKGIELILRTSHLLSLNGIKHNWKVAGISKDDLIVKIAKKHLNIPGVDRCVTYLGSIDEQKLIDHLLVCNIYVMPSHVENSPNNLCEAMILGLPCIATYAGGTSSLLTDGLDGLLVQTGDPWSLAGAILELYRNFDKAVELGVKARARALKRHSKEKILADLLDIYEEVKRSHCDN